jgi:hypothetical protein
MSLMRTALVAGWSLLLPVSASLAEDIQTQERIIEHQLDTTESRVLRRSERPLAKEELPGTLGEQRLRSPDRLLEQQQLRRDLGATEQRLRSFKTEHPNAASTPLLERQLDRLNRPARIREPGPPSLLDRD